MQKEEIVISAQKSSSARISAMLVMGKQLWVNHFDGVIQIISTDTKSIKFSSLSSPTLLKTDGKPMKSICKVFRKIDEITPQINVWATARFEKLIYVWDALVRSSSFLIYYYLFLDYNYLLFIILIFLIL